MHYQFTVGKKYSRKDLRQLTGQSPESKGGDWDTGYAELNDEFFIFCNIGRAGRTGFDHGNHFIGDDLVWFTKGNKSRASAQTQRLLSQDTVKYLFTRDNERDDFVYRGTVKAKHIEDDEPVKIIWEINAKESPPSRYYARLCWNTACWVHPTGDAPKSESKTFANEHGFGHEEWLFDFNRSMEGYQVGFIQGVNFSYKKLSGTTFSVELYTLAPDGQRFIVGKIDRVTALTDEEAEAAKKYFQKSGWLKLMAQQVEAVAGNSQILDVGTEGLGMFNVRFKTEDVTIYDPFRPVAENDRVRRLTRYRLVSMDDEPADDEEPLSEQREISRRGTQSLKSTAPIIRRSSEAKAFDPVHNHLQNKIFELLRQRFGVDKVLMEDNFVDIKVIKPGKVVYLEIKTDPTPRKAIRQALGQLMDYAFFASPTRELVQLIVVAPGELRPTDENYVQRLTQEFKIPISYRQFTLESREFDIDS